MTDTEMERRKAICEVAGVADIDDVSDGFHTFKQLYHQRMMVFATIVKQNKDKAWKSLRHEDGELCFGGGWFVVGIDTPDGSYTYHYENKYFDLFDCEILDYAKHWDGHTEKDVTRLLSLPTIEPEPKWIPCSERLPEEHIGFYLVTVQKRGITALNVVGCDNTVHDIDIARWDYDRRAPQRGYHWCKADKVIAWMPLPEPYLEEGE